MTSRARVRRACTTQITCRTVADGMGKINRSCHVFVCAKEVVQLYGGCNVEAVRSRRLCRCGAADVLYEIGCGRQIRTPRQRCESYNITCPIRASINITYERRVTGAFSFVHPSWFCHQLWHYSDSIVHIHLHLHTKLAMRVRNMEGWGGNGQTSGLAHS